MLPSALAGRQMPDRRRPMIVGGTVVVFALPFFLLAGWTIRGWALGALLWTGGQVLEFLFARIGIAGQPSLRGSGVVAFGMLSRGVLIMLVAFLVAASNPAVGVAGAILYAVAYTAELAAFLAILLTGAPR